MTPNGQSRSERMLDVSGSAQSCARATTEGTERTAVLDERNHCSPINVSAGGAGNVRQLAGNVSTATASIAMSSWISTGIASKSVGSRSESVWTNRSSAASDSVADANTAGMPRGVQQLP